LSSFIALTAGAVVLSGATCNSGSTAPPTDLAQARARWARVGPTAYQYTIFRACECTAEMSGPAVVTVRNGVVQSRVYAQSGAAVPAQLADAFPAVEGLFALVDDAIRNNTTPLVVQYDAAFGYPKEIAIGNRAADGPVVTVSDFRAQ
jgi:hypothetical protein